MDKGIGLRSDLGMERGQAGRETGSRERRGGTEPWRSACLRCLPSRVIETTVLFMEIINRNCFLFVFFPLLP
jgi:hypothetical protein